MPRNSRVVVIGYPHLIIFTLLEYAVAAGPAGRDDHQRNRGHFRMCPSLCKLLMLLLLVCSSVTMQSDFIVFIL
jgi:hypothetical protein